MNLIIVFGLMIITISKCHRVDDNLKCRDYFTKTKVFGDFQAQTFCAEISTCMEKYGDIDTSHYGFLHCHIDACAKTMMEWGHTVVEFQEYCNDLLAFEKKWYHANFERPPVGSMVRP
ncbi:uncharacterized protein LOC123296286 [Chrysoperla carnea]|uniref:uncharacterized protein LOC123296286 n=1 Tax=Chrysoperla carnea TaxID=189513 RepID=UPI001D084303|nr:uncharacterized protein LOC123296286 [Chrysoperla carnea]